MRQGARSALGHALTFALPGRSTAAVTADDERQEQGRDRFDELDAPCPDPSQARAHVLGFASAGPGPCRRTPRAVVQSWARPGDGTARSNNMEALMAPRPKTSSLNVRVTADEMEYLQGMADELEITLSDAVRAAISRSILRDVEHGEREADDDLKWIARNARTVTASPLAEPRTWEDGNS